MILFEVACAVLVYFWVGNLVLLANMFLGDLVLGEAHPILCVAVLITLWPLVLAEWLILAWRGYGPPLDS